MAIHLKAARINAGYTQDQAAKALKIAKSTLANYEKYKTTPDIEMAKRIARLYNTTVDNIIFFAE
jgi:DNA-binding XRE family transcriptional regulator